MRLEAVPVCTVLGLMGRHHVRALVEALAGSRGALGLRHARHPAQPRRCTSAMGKDVAWRHLQVFMLGCATCGIAGAMLTTLDGQFTPTGNIPLRSTFLIWVMVILGDSDNNWGAILLLVIRFAPEGSFRSGRTAERADARRFSGNCLETALNQALNCLKI
jgi:hypothetical protein